MFVLSLVKPTNNRKKNIIPPSEQTAWIWIFLMKFESFTPAEVTEEAIGMAQVAFRIPMDRRLKKADGRGLRWAWIAPSMKYGVFDRAFLY